MISPICSLVVCLNNIIMILRHNSLPQFHSSFCLSPICYLLLLKDLDIKPCDVCQNFFVVFSRVVFLWCVTERCQVTVASMFREWLESSFAAFSTLEVQLGCIHSVMELICKLIIMAKQGCSLLLRRSLTVHTACSAAPFAWGLLVV